MAGRRLINNDPFGIKIDCKLHLCANGCGLWCAFCGYAVCGCGLWMRFVDAVCDVRFVDVRFVMCGVRCATLHQ